MNLRSYIAFNTSLANGAEIDLETAYNATKTGADKISDGTVSGVVSFQDIIFFHDGEITVKPESVLKPYNDYVTFEKTTTATFEKNMINGGRNVLFKNSSGSTVLLKIYAGLTQNVVNTTVVAPLIANQVETDNIFH